MVSREELYELVWSIPMIKVAEKFLGLWKLHGSRLLGSECSASREGVLGPTGSWKSTVRPALPEALPGDQLFWSQEGDPPAPRVRC
jgi:hypothetical protein